MNEKTFGELTDHAERLKHVFGVLDDAVKGKNWVLVQTAQLMIAVIVLEMKA